MLLLWVETLHVEFASGLVGGSGSTYWYHGKWKIEQQIKQGTCTHKLGYPLKIKHTAVQVPGQVPNLNKCKHANHWQHTFGSIQH